MVDSVIDGYNGTIFAYGQTGTGKTHTMDGGPTPDAQGIIPNSFDHIFNAIAASDDREFLVRVSFLGKSLLAPRSDPFPVLPHYR